MSSFASLLASLCLVSGLAVSAPGGDPSERSGDPPAPTRLSPAELRIWNAPDFRRRFAESYMAETDIEPVLTEDEREEIMDILELISADEMDEAAEDLLDLVDGTTTAVYDFEYAPLPLPSPLSAKP